MKKRSKRARESLTLVQLAQRLVVGVGVICLFFLGIYLLNQWYLYSRSHENQAPVPQLSTEHPDNLTPEVNPDQCANEP
ncbi:MAG: hypothetical protein JXD19_03100, partial [Deltaproteobacteria bacterium]|nr:hypothetical protein [Deltaproteobacteria bacterium]